VVLLKKYHIKKIYHWNPRRLFINLSVCFIIIGLFSLIAAQTTRANNVPEEVIVRPGDTIWQIALKTRPREDPRRTMEAIRTANQLETLTVMPGQLLIIP